MALTLPSLHLSARDLSVQRGHRLLFSGLEFDLGPGQGLLVTGRNGVGKTTLLRMVAGLIRPAHGTLVTRLGDQPLPPEDRIDHLLYLAHRDGLTPTRTVADEIRFWSQWFQGPLSTAGTKALGLDPLLPLPCRVLSAGQQRRVALSRLWNSSRPLWILDEPLSPLDQDTRALVCSRLQKHLNDGGSLIMTAHDPVDLPLIPLDLNTVAV